MAIYNHSDNSTPAAKPSNDNTTIITEGATLKGEMNLECNLYVDGHFEGVVHSENNITIGKKGSIKGDVHTHNIVIQGSVEGSVEANRVEIKSGGKVIGSIISSEFIIESRGIFEGDSKMKLGEPEVPALDNTKKMPKNSKSKE